MNTSKILRARRWSVNPYGIQRLQFLLIFLSVMLASCALNVAGDARLPNHVVMLGEKGGLIDIGKHDKCQPESRNCNFFYSELNHDDGKERIVHIIEELISFKDNKSFLGIGCKAGAKKAFSFN